LLSATDKTGKLIQRKKDKMINLRKEISREEIIIS
jgi:hypothetical protein